MTMETLAIWLFGAVIGAVMAIAFSRRARHLRGQSLVPVFKDSSGPAAVDPAHPDLPDGVDPTQEKKIELIPHAELRTLVQTLRSWKLPPRHQHEEAFQRSFQRHVLKSGHDDSAVARHPRVPWTAEDRDPNSDDHRAVPDFSFKRVLVEIKRNITVSSETDRALGQMARYCVAWRRTGPALLIVCNEYDHNLRMFVERTVRGWKAQGIPVMAYFARHPSVADGDDEFPAGTFDSIIEST